MTFKQLYNLVTEGMFSKPNIKNRHSIKIDVINKPIMDEKEIFNRIHRLDKFAISLNSAVAEMKSMVVSPDGKDKYALIQRKDEELEEQWSTMLFRGHKVLDPFSKTGDSKAKGDLVYWAKSPGTAAIYSRNISDWGTEGQQYLNILQRNSEGRGDSQIKYNWGYITIAQPKDSSKLRWYNNFGVEDEIKKREKDLKDARDKHNQTNPHLTFNGLPDNDNFGGKLNKDQWNNEIQRRDALEKDYWNNVGFDAFDTEEEFNKKYEELDKSFYGQKFGFKTKEEFEQFKKTNPKYWEKLGFDTWSNMDIDENQYDGQEERRLLKGMKDKKKDYWWTRKGQYKYDPQIKSPKLQGGNVFSARYKTFSKPSTQKELGDTPTRSYISQTITRNAETVLSKENVSKIKTFVAHFYDAGAVMLYPVSAIKKYDPELYKVLNQDSL